MPSSKRSAMWLFRMSCSVIFALLVMDIVARWAYSNDPGANTLSFKMAFDLDEEHNVPSFLSALQLGVASWILGLLALRDHRSGGRNFGNWAFLSLVFCYLSFDEYFVVHEYAGELMKGRLHASGIFSYSWVIPAMLFVSLIGAMNIPFLFRLPVRYRVGFLFSGAIYVFSAVGGDMVVGGVHEYFPALEAHHFQLMENLAEECGEMLSIAWFINLLLRYAREHASAIAHHDPFVRTKGATVKVMQRRDAMRSAR